MKPNKVKLKRASNTNNSIEVKPIKTILLPEVGFLRLHHIIGNSKANPPIPAIIPLSKSAWWAAIKAGDAPKPGKLFGTRVSIWSVDVIRALVRKQERKQPGLT